RASSNTAVWLTGRGGAGSVLPESKDKDDSAPCTTPRGLASQGLAARKAPESGRVPLPPPPTGGGLGQSRQAPMAPTAPAVPKTDRRESDILRKLSPRLLQGEQVLIGSRPRYVEANWPQNEQVPGARCKCARFRGICPTAGQSHPPLGCAEAGEPRVETTSRIGDRSRLDCAPVFAPPPRGRPHAPLLAAGAAAAASTASGPTQASGSSCARCSISSRCRHSSMRSSRGRSLRRGTRRRRSTQRSLHTGRRRDTVQDTHARALR
ncbi:unnamed protein product, partial [Prorocentrum cordatum]